MVILGLIFPVLTLGATVYALIGTNIESISKTDKYILQQRDKSITDLYFLDGKTYSSQFYSAGKIKEISEDKLLKEIQNDHAFEILIEKKYLKDREEDLINKLTPVAENKDNILYKYQPK